VSGVVFDMADALEDLKYSRRVFPHFLNSRQVFTSSEYMYSHDTKLSPNTALIVVKAALLLASRSM
jgi:hypothetical protein